MKRLTLITTTLVALVATPLFAQMQSPRASQMGKVFQTVGLTDVEIAFSRPGVRDRTIWGDLVPWNQVWRTGANEATKITFSNDVTIEGKPLAAGTYALFTIPTDDAWTVIFNKNHSQWGSGQYSEDEDALRVRVKPVRGEHVEWMTFRFPEIAADSATLEFAWDNLRLPIRIGTATNAAVLESAREAIAAMENWRTPYRAATWGLDAGVELDELTKWAEQAVALDENYSTRSLQAQVLARAGNKKEARIAAQKALKLAEGMENKPNTSATEELLKTLR